MDLINNFDNDWIEMSEANCECDDDFVLMDEEDAEMDRLMDYYAKKYGNVRFAK